jgi:hypothetical protein
MAEDVAIPLCYYYIIANLVMMPAFIQSLFQPDNFKPPRHPSKSSMKKDQTFWTALSKMES